MGDYVYFKAKDGGAYVAQPTMYKQGLDIMRNSGMYLEISKAEYDKAVAKR